MMIMIIYYVVTIISLCVMVLKIIFLVDVCKLRKMLPEYKSELLTYGILMLFFALIISIVYLCFIAKLDLEQHEVVDLTQVQSS